MKPAFAYFGGKMGMADFIVGLMPEHSVYLEPFFGSGAVLFAKRPARFEIVNDLDGALVNFWRVLRERTEELRDVCALTPHARAEYLAADLSEDRDDLERARRFWVRINQSFGKTAGDRSGWSLSMTCSQPAPATVFNRLGRFQGVAARLAGVSIEQCDGADLARRLVKTPETLVYADPPYLGTSRVGQSARCRDYRCDMASSEEHEQLAETLLATPAKVIVSGYPSSLYESLYAGWTVIDREVTAFSSNGKTAHRTGRIERLWLNYEPCFAPTTRSLFDVGT